MKEQRQMGNPLNDSIRPPAARRPGGGRTRLRSGAFTSVTVLFLVTLALLTVFVMANVSIGQVRLSARGQNRAIGLTLAEAGIDDTQDRLRMDGSFGINSTTGASLDYQSAVTLYEDPGTDKKPLGRFQVKVEKVDDKRRRVRSRAQRPDGSLLGVEVVAMVNVEETNRIRGAIVANGPVDLKGNASIQSQALGSGEADVLSNAIIEVNGSAYVDGHLAAGMTVVGDDSGNRHSPFRFRNNRPPIPFPNDATLEDWRRGYERTATRAGATRVRGVVRDSQVIVGPAYIEGDIDLNSRAVVELLPTPGTKAEDNIVYVTGNVKLSSNGRLTSRAILVVMGTFDQNGGTYSAPFTTTLVDRWTPALLVYGSDPDGRNGKEAVQLNGNGSTDQSGVVFVANGSVRVNGTADFIGAIVAADPDATVRANGNYKHIFPDDMRSPLRFDREAAVESVVEL